VIGLAIPVTLTLSEGTERADSQLERPLMPVLHLRAPLERTERSIMWAPWTNSADVPNRCGVDVPEATKG
jgi:hypothetical protein